MKKPIFMLLAAGLFAFASCDSPAEERSEEQAEQVEESAEEMEEAGEEQADQMEDAADEMDTTEVQ